MSWKNDKSDELPKKEKIRKKSFKPVQKQEKEFILEDKKKIEDLLKKGYFLARVSEVQKKYIFLAPEKKLLKIETEDVWLSTVAKKFLQNQRKERNFIVVGDRVLCLEAHKQDSEDFPQCTIEFRLPRETVISRVDPLVESRDHLLASNLSQLIIVASYLNPEVRWRLLDRFLVQAEHERLKTVIILNKKDLLESADESFQQECKDYEKIYKGLGYEVLSFDTIEASKARKVPKFLSKLFKDHITLIAGHSGVGKSSITNLLNPEIEQDVEEIEIFRKGRHTTTYSSLIKLGTGGFIIDTPGIRSFTLRDPDSLKLGWGFVEMRPFLGTCRYRMCEHNKEPGCKIKEAVESGEISKQRYESYLNLLLRTDRREGRYTLD